MAELATTSAVEPRAGRRYRRTDIVIVVVIFLLIAGSAYIGERKSSHKLDAFAKCLAAKHTSMYGLFWCPDCAEQKRMFEASFEYVPYVECGIPGSHNEEPACLKAGIRDFPTWQFADGSRSIGTQQLTFLSEKTGCTLP